MSTINVEQGGDLTNLLSQASQISINLQRDYRQLADENVVLRHKVTELEEEVQYLRQSLGSTGQPTTGSTGIGPFTPRSISSLSVEIILMIFAVLLPEEDTPHCETSAWMVAFSAKFAFLRVCRLWYNSCIDRLYEHVHLSRLAQLPRLVRTLEASGTKWLARSILRVDLNFFVPNGWEKLYSQDLRRFLSLCPSIRSMDHSLSYDGQAKQGPVIYSTLAMFLNNITFLNLGHDGMSFEIQCRLISSLTRLRELEFHPGILDNSPEDYTQNFTATLPHLISLIIFLDNGTCRSIRHLTLWTIPSIRRLCVTITSDDPGEAIQLLHGLCSAHGANMTFFNLTLSSIPNASILANLATHFPKIEHLAFHPAYEQILHYPAMPFLLQIDFMDPSRTGLEHHLRFIAESRDSHFPSLKVIRIFDVVYLGDPTNYVFVPRPYLDMLRNWTEVAKTLGIELQNNRGDALEIHRDYPEVDRGSDLAKLLEHEHENDLEEENDDTYESPTSEDDDSFSDSDVSLANHAEDEPEMDHDTVLRLWDEERQDEGDDES
ncbi:hypothetical protein BD410DRAFT_902391 [Rickenella mellea]|uniref:F-box domain-containing protein n=1 Tax=Rickenella mellea TaxID=50990 RepID=A0A4Y7PL92_9AGAM|nr:hypothetical protein BD410DRAFT_902391 [Rickenella mellea]